MKELKVIEAETYGIGTTIFPDGSYGIAVFVDGGFPCKPAAYKLTPEAALSDSLRLMYFALSGLIVNHALRPLRALWNRIIAA